MSLICFLVPKQEVRARIDGAVFAMPDVVGFDPAMLVRPPAPAAVPGGVAHILEDLAFARSGEKGETINIGVIARKPEHLPALRAALTETMIKAWLPDLGDFRVTVYDLPGCHALNLVLEGALPGGLNASQRLDPAAKSIAQRMMRFPVG